MKSLGYRSRSSGSGRADAWRYLLFSAGWGLGVGFVTVLLGLYLLAIGLSETFVATQELVIALGSGLLSIPAGMLVDRLGVKPAILLAVAFTLSGRFVLFAGTTEPVLILASAGTAVGVASYWVSQGPALALLASEDRRSAIFGLNWTLYSLASLLGGVLAGVLPGLIGRVGPGVTPVETYRYSMYAGLLLLGLCAVPVLGLSRRRPTRAVSTQRWWKISRPARLAAALLPIVTLALAGGATVPFMSIFLQGAYGASTAAIGLVLGLFALTSAVGGLLGPRVAARFGRDMTVLWTIVLSAPFLLLTGFAPSLATAAAALWARGILLNCAVPLALGAVIDAVDENERGKASGFMNISFEVGWAAATLPTGLIMERVSYRLPHALAAGALIAGGLAIRWAIRGHQRGKAPERASEPS